MVAEGGETSGLQLVVLALCTEEAAWLAGILEGEGSFLVKGHRAAAIQVVIMTDRDIIDRLVVVTGVGRIHGYAPVKAHYKPAWDWHVRRAHIIFIIDAVMPWLGNGELSPLNASLTSSLSLCSPGRSRTFKPSP